MYERNEIIEIDLDGDNVKEEIKILGRTIAINDKEYVANKFYKENNNNDRFSTYDLAIADYLDNFYNFVDINGDGILEIIHRTYTNSISPSTNIYTIYNYKNSNLKEIGNISIIGNIPNQIYVKANTIKFKYHPYEYQKGHAEEVVYELNV